MNKWQFEFTQGIPICKDISLELIKTVKDLKHPVDCCALKKLRKSSAIQYLKSRHSIATKAIIQTSAISRQRCTHN